MADKDAIKIRVFKTPDTFGYQMQLFLDHQDGSRSVVTDLQFEKYSMGQELPKQASLPVDKESLIALAAYLKTEGLMDAPFATYQRVIKDHQLEELEVENKHLQEALAECNKVLQRITGSLEELIEKYGESK